MRSARLRALADPGGPHVSGPPETVYDWARERCATWDIPDTPARAWRAADGSVRLVAGAEESRAAAGPDLAHLTRDCAVLYRGAGSPDPGAYDDRAWIHATWTADGVRSSRSRTSSTTARPTPAAAMRRRPPTAGATPSSSSAPTTAAGPSRRAGLVAALPWRYSAARRPARRLLQPEQHRPPRRPPLRLRLGGGASGPSAAAPA